jgi:hypothetical protein
MGQKRTKATRFGTLAPGKNPLFFNYRLAFCGTGNAAKKTLTGTPKLPPIIFHYQGQITARRPIADGCNSHSGLVQLTANRRFRPWCN